MPDSNLLETYNIYAEYMRTTCWFTSYFEWDKQIDKEKRFWTDYVKEVTSRDEVNIPEIYNIYAEYAGRSNWFPYVTPMWDKLPEDKREFWTNLINGIVERHRLINQ